jgi:hypothetical protein
MPAGPQRDAAEQQLSVVHYQMQQAMGKVSADEIGTAEAAYSEWFTKTYQPNKATLEIAFNAWARALGSAEQKGCGEGLLPEITKQFRAKNLKNVQEMDAQWRDPVVGVLLQAKAVCDAYEDPSLGAGEIGIANLACAGSGRGAPR